MKGMNKKQAGWGIENAGSFMCEDFVNILIYNWRDIKNPASGGAEILTHEIAKRLVSKGHKITIFTAAFAGCKKNKRSMVWKSCDRAFATPFI
jgi:hypothetical protein